MWWFNDFRCQPKWSEHELRHKVNDAEKMVKASGRYNARDTGPRHSRKSRTFTAPPVPIRRPAPIYLLDEATENAWWARVFVERGIADPAGKV
jgi:hypothetical protein